MEELKEEFKDDKFFITYPWMAKALKLKGLESKVFAIIHGYTVNGEGCYFGGRRYLAEICGCSIRGVDEALKRLVDNNFLLKHYWRDKKRQRRCKYTSNITEISKLKKIYELEKEQNEKNAKDNVACVMNSVYKGTAESATGVLNSLHDGTAESAPNNISKSKNFIINTNLSECDWKIKKFGLYGNVRLTDNLYAYLNKISNGRADEYINKCDTFIEEGHFNVIRETCGPEAFVRHIETWMKEDGVTSD